MNTVSHSDNDTQRLALDLGRRRIRFGTELAMQADVGRHLAALAGHYGACLSEHIFDKKNRIDFYLPDVGVGVECKVQGSVATVAEQLQRYAQRDEVRGLVLVTRCRAHRLPTTIAGKPLRVIWVAGML